MKLIVSVKSVWLSDSSGGSKIFLHNYSVCSNFASVDFQLISVVLFVV